jgi:hypothetical protein
MEALVLGAFFTGLALFTWYLSASEARRRRELAQVARRAGLAYLPEDPAWRLPPFELFREGDERGTEHHLIDTAAPGQPRVFDYWFCEITRDRNGGEHRSYTRRTCALLDAGWMWPKLSITREGLMTRAAKLAGVRDLDFESEEFNRTFFVTTSDERFATAFLDAGMIDLLVGTKGAIDVDVEGRWVVCHMKRLSKGAEVAALLRFGERLAAQIPPVVDHLFPRPAPSHPMTEGR